MFKLIAILLVFCTGLTSDFLIAAPREAAGGSAKVVAKLQAMVKDITSERDALATERDGLKTELDKLTAEINTLKQEKSAAAAAESRLTSEIAVQKHNNDEMKGRYERTNAKLLEVIDKYNALNKEKNELFVEHGKLQNTQKSTSTELAACESKNIKMYEVTKEVVDNYQKRGVWDSLFESEPFFQIKNVETEMLLQEYQDKLNKQKYQKGAASTSTAASVEEASEESVQTHQ